MDPTQRFSNRVEDYVRYRPSYPVAALDLLSAKCGLIDGTPVADVGSGTGIFTQLLLGRGAEVFAVEPNAAMRQAAERALSPNARFHSIDAPAEATTLPDASVDLVTCAQAFHWFANPRAVAEFRRILRPQGHVFLVWNHRIVDDSPASAAYEELLRAYAPDYQNVRHRDTDDQDIARLFGMQVETHAFPSRQVLNRAAFVGRVLSSSYVPAAGSAEHEPFVARLNAHFDEFGQSGTLTWEYRTDGYLVQPN